MAKKALVVDDSACFRDMVSATLASAGFEVLQGNNGREGLDRLGTSRVDIIITDLNMPVMDGLTFVKEIRTRRQCRATPILILTTESLADMKAKGKAAGATGWIVKPFKPADLLRVVNDILP